MEPMNPTHADTVKSIPGVDSRFTIKRHLVGYAYPANGNTHRPTPKYLWILQLDGRTVDTGNSRRDLVTYLRENEESYLKS